jgi:hypothetical protein
VVAVIEFTIPIRTVSALNAREHHMARARRVKKEREATAWAITLAELGEVELPATVTLIRLGPTPGLDDGDNLAASQKGVRDEIAKWLGVDDRSPQVKWRYGQRRQKHWGVCVHIEPEKEVPHGAALQAG